MNLRKKGFLVAAALSAMTTVSFGQQCFSPPVAQTLLPDSPERRAVAFTKDQSPGVLALFPLSRTLDNIIVTSRVDQAAPVTDADRESLLNSLLGTFEQTSLTNPQSDTGLTFPVSVRTGEAALDASSLIGQMEPVGLFNRLDLAPKSFANCGEYRIVYAKKNPTTFDRFFLIFEAALPNPDPLGGKDACREVASFWDSLQHETDAIAGPQLEAFYYAGNKVPNGTVDFEPVIHYQHFGLPDGQVRSNAFIPNNAFLWHLMQWRIVPDAAGISFHHTPVNENPVPSFFGTGPATGVPVAVYDRMGGQFRNEFVGSNVAQLVDTDRTALLQAMPGEALINRLGVDISDKFYAVESNADDIDDPTAIASGTTLVADIDGQLTKLKVDQCSVSAVQVLNRMGAMTCGGCHQFSNNASIAPGVDWPRSLGFVQINEDGKLSPLLTDHFLSARLANVREMISNSFLEEASPPSPTVGQRALLAQYLDALKSTGSGFFEEDRSADLALATLLNDQVRATSQGEAGAFTVFRKPD